jgi:hypothetical protein
MKAMELVGLVVCPKCKATNKHSATFCKVCAEPLGIKYDEEKADWTLFPFSAGEAIVRIMMFGCKKYTRDNWKHVQPGQRYLAAAIRHIGRWLDGEAKDSETGCSHLWHAGCCLVFAIWLEIEGKMVCQQNSK